MYTIVLHVANSEPVKVDVDELPTPSDTLIVGKNPRERNDKEFPWVDEGVTTVMFPVWRINYIQVVPTTEGEVDIELPFRD